MAGWARKADRGSTVPLILGLFLIAVLVVAGAIAAGDAFVQQRQLQDDCDGAAVAAASAADLDSGRHSSDFDDTGGAFLALGPVQSAVDTYRERDAGRSSITMVATLGADGVTVSVHCTVTRTIAFGALFGHSGGVIHQATSTSRGHLRR